MDIHKTTEAQVITAQIKVRQEIVFPGKNGMEALTFVLKEAQVKVENVA